jgi:putative ABC transport system permease protein
MTCEEGKAIQIKIGSKNREALLGFINETCRRISPGTENRMCFLDDYIENLYKPELDLRKSFRIYSFITVFIAMLGLFGLTLIQAGKRTKEITIRKIHGAGLFDTFRRFAGDHFLILLISNSIAVPVTIQAMNKWLGNFRYKVAIDPFIFIKSFLIIIIITLLANSFLIIRTHKTNILSTLKHE